jgi:hypothetical protein
MWDFLTNDNNGGNNLSSLLLEYHLWCLLFILAKTWLLPESQIRCWFRHFLFWFFKPVSLPYFYLVPTPILRFDTWFHHLESVIQTSALSNWLWLGCPSCFYFFVFLFLRQGLAQADLQLVILLQQSPSLGPQPTSSKSGELVPLHPTFFLAVSTLGYLK